MGDYADWAASLGLETCNQSDVGSQYACSQRNDAKIQAWGSSPEQVSYQSTVAATEAASVQQAGGDANAFVASWNANNAIAPVVLTTQNTVVPANQNVSQSQNKSAPVPTNGNGSFSIVNTTTGSPNIFQVGDGFRIQITGAAPNSPIVATSTQNGVSHGSNNIGTTDANGNFSLVGAMNSTTIGTWTEQWKVGNQTFNISFSVANPTQVTTGQQNTSLAPTESVNAAGQPTNTTNSTTYVPVSVPTSGGTFFSDFGTGLSELFTPSDWSTVLQSGNMGEIVGLLSVPAIAAVYMFNKHKGRR